MADSGAAGDPSPTDPPPQDAESFAARIGATPGQMADLESFRALLADWNERLNLVGPSALQAFWPRHAFDSAQLLALAPQAKVWADIGAGAGFPGLVLAILLKGRDDACVHLIESLAKRCRFLTEVTNALTLPVVVHNARAESLRLTGIDIVTARACAPLPRLLSYAQPLLRGRARGLFLKGREVEAEIAEAKKAWRFKVALIPSLSDPSGRIVQVEGLSRG